MSENPYEAPKGELIDPGAAADSADFYVVSKKKMLVLFIATLGMYRVYWMYRHWQSFKQVSGARIWPVARAIFSIFYIHSLFRLVGSKRDNATVPMPAWDHKQQATFIVLILIFSHVLDRLVSKSIGSPVTDILSLLTLLPLAACFGAAQVKINEACGDPGGELNSQFTFANYVWIAIGVLLWVLVGIGLFMTEQV